MIAGGAAGFLLLWIIIKSQMTYDIGRRHLKIKIIGIPMRRFLLTNIERVGKKELGVTQERWHNSWGVSHRQVVIRKRQGWPRELSVTPSQRYVFITELEQAIARAEAKAQARLQDSTGRTSIVPKE